MQNTFRTRIAMIATFIAMAFVFAPVAVYAQASLGFPSEFAGFSSQALLTTIENIVRIVLGFVGLLFIIVAVWGGITWMTSNGAPEKIAKAKKILTAAAIGMLVTMSSYAIASLVIGSYQGSLTGGGSPPSGGGPGSLTGYGTALGAGVLESHYPIRDQRDVPRNTHILVTFKEEIDPTSVCQMLDVAGPGGVGVPDGVPESVVIPGAVNIQDIDSRVPEPPDTDDELDSDLPFEDDTLEVVYCSTIDNKTFKFDPGSTGGNHLGLSTGNVRYKVTLTSDDTNHWIQILSDGSDALSSFGYNWFFTVSTFLDTTPPVITNVYPPQSALVPRNALVMITFSEPIDPVSASGFTDGTGPFVNITLDDTYPPLFTQGSPYVPGQYRISNGYTTIEFYSDDACGTNSCGDQIFCLPETARIFGHVNNQVVDLASNAFDCEDGGVGQLPSGDGTASCPPTDYYEWYFDTDATMDLEGPYIETRTPFYHELDVGVNDPVVTTFNEIIIPSSAGSSNYGFDTFDALCWDGTRGVPFWTGVDFVDIDSPPDSIADVSVAYIYHGRYYPYSDYCPIATSGIKDAQQNCYLPSSCDINLPVGIGPEDDTDGDLDVDGDDCSYPNPGALGF